MESDIAPAAQLLIYAILPNGEIVADTEKLEIENCFANKVGLLCKQFFYSSPLLKYGKEGNCIHFLNYHRVLLKLPSVRPPKAENDAVPCLRGLVEKSGTGGHKSNVFKVSCFILKFIWNSKYALL